MTEHTRSTVLELDDRLQRALERVPALVPFDSGGVLLYDAAAERLEPVAYRGVHTAALDAIPLGEGIVGWVALHLVPAIVPDMRDDDRCVFYDPASRAELAVPLIADGALVGVLNVESHRPDAYTRDHRLALEGFAEPLAQVIALAQTCRTLRQTIHERQRETEALYRLAIITSTSREMGDMLPSAVREAAELLECGGAQVLLPDPLTYSLKAHAESRYGDARDWPVTELPLDGSGHAVHVYHTGVPYAGHAPNADGPDSGNYLICPLNTHGRTLGVLELVNRRDGQFTEADQEIAQTIANQIAVSMGSVERLTTEQRRTEMLGRINRVSQDLYATLDPQDLLRRLAQQVLEVFGHDAVHVLLLEPSGATVQVQAGARSGGDTLPDGYAFPADSEVLGDVLRSGQSHIIADVRDLADDWVLARAMPWMQSCLVVALQQGDETIGVLSLSSTQLDAFSELERDALEMLARQVSVALENAHLYHQAQRRLIEQGIVHQIGQDLAAILDYRDLSQAIVEHMNRALHTSACTLGLYEPEHGAVQVDAQYHAPRHHDPDWQNLVGHYLMLEAHPAIHDAIRTRQPVTAYREDPATGDAARHLLEASGDHSRLIVPMVTGDRVIGIVDWTDNQSGRRFTSDDLLLAQTLVAQATIALENALLFRQLEQRADELAEAYRLRSQFLATVSHELRTPMNSIIGFTETLLDGIYGEMTDAQISRMERIRKNSYHLLALIDDLLDLSKIEAGRMTLELEVIGVGDVIMTAVDSLRGKLVEKDLALDLHIPDDLPRVEADPQRLYQIVKNLLNNAVKFTHEGRITVRCEAISRRGRPFVQTSVTDTGIGISEEARAFIFDSFRQVDSSSTRAYGGTGMGLAITKKLIEMLGGDIHVESVVGEGSTFTFALPVAKADRLGDVAE